MSITSDYRPQAWEDVLGQGHVTDILQNAIRQNVNKGLPLPNAYLFVGVRGTGKTTSARLLAKTLNCANKVDAQPCNECRTCAAIAEGKSLDVKEFDMASNRGIDDVRAIQDSVQYAPTGGRYRIVIMDEAHQMTSQAASALLKILEEPPKNVIFILATTELQKILPTIRSRCQVHSFRKIDEKLISSRLQSLCFTITDKQPDDEVIAACDLIAKSSDGSMRDAEGRLSSLLSLENISIEGYKNTFGAGGKGTFKEFLEMCLNKDRAGIILEFDRISQDISDPQGWALDLANFIFSQIALDAKNIDIYLGLLDVIEEYLRAIFNNQPVIFLKLMLLRMAK